MIFPVIQSELICQRGLFRYSDAANGYKQIQTTQIFREMPFAALSFADGNRIYTLLNISESQGFLINLMPNMVYFIYRSEGLGSVLFIKLITYTYCRLQLSAQKFSVILHYFKLVFKCNDLVKSHEFNYRWLSKKVHIQGVVFFQKRGHTRSMPSVCKNTTTQ